MRVFPSPGRVNPHSSLDRLLAPERIAVVGVSADPTKHGARVVANLRRLGFPGVVWGVNPRLPQVDGVAVYPSLSDLPGVPDVVACALPAAGAVEVVREAAEMGAGVVVVFAGGFTEAGEQGRRLQADLVTSAGGTRVLGPNSGGVIRPGRGLAVSFLTCLDRPADQIRSGPVGLATQSGGTGSHIHNLAAARGSGLAASISTGNEADLGLADAVEALAALDEVKVVAVVLEAVRRGPEFMAAIRGAHQAGKPVVACRLGTSNQGRRMMTSHTGAMAGPARVLDGVLDALGVTVTETPGEMLEVAEVLARTPVPAGDRVGVVTHSGGIAILLADLAEKQGVVLPSPGPGVRKRLAPLLEQGSSGNPLDMGAIIGGPQRFAQVVGALLDSGEFDLVLATSTAHPPAHTVTRVTGLLALRSQKPLIHLWMAGDLGDEGLAMLRGAGAAVTDEPRAAMRALAGLARFRQVGEADHSPMVEPVAGPGLEPGRLTEHQAKEVLARWGVPLVPGGLATAPEEAVALADRIGYPVVVKVSSPDISHKTEVGGIRLGLGDPAQVIEAFHRVVGAVGGASPGAVIDGVRVERHQPGLEIIVGMVRDATFGPIVLVGLGGVLTEVLDDVAAAPGPISALGAERLVSRLRGRQALDGHRGAPGSDVGALAELVSALSAHFAADRSLAEIEINPLTWTEDGWLAVDALVQVGPPPAR